MPSDNDAIKVLDFKIEETQRLAAEAQRWANRLSQLVNDLLVLKRARELLLSDESSGEKQRGYIPVFAPSPSTQAPSTTPEAQGEGEGGTQISIGALVVKVLNEAGTPLPVQTILACVRAKGRPEVTLKTLGGVISQYLTGGKIQRTARATYALPSTNGNGAAMHGS
jgi:hypothetical protein